MSYQYEPIPQLASIRLLHLSPGIDEALECGLLFANLRDKPSYEALSYVWGDASNRTTIQCDGKSLSITVSLATALGRLREPSNTKVLWADAICINQEDILERNLQIPLMGQIFSNALCVLSWLGNENGNAKYAFSLIHRIANHWPYTYESNGWNNLPLLPASDSIFDDRRAWKAICSLIDKNPYFKRAWIQQEIGLARDAIIYWGGYKISWDVLTAVSSFLIRHSPILYERFGLQSSTRLYNAGHLYNEQRLEVNGETTFWHLLAIARRLEVTDERDMIYCFLTHPSARERDGQQPFILPDYSKSVDQVYTEVATKGLVSQNNPLVLSLVFHASDISKRRMPSWVHDLVRQDGFPPVINWHSDYTTGTADDRKMIVSATGSKLLIHGAIFGYTAQFSDELSNTNSFEPGEDNLVLKTLSFVQNIETTTAYNSMSADKLTCVAMTAPLNSMDDEYYLASFQTYCDSIRHPRNNDNIEDTNISFLHNIRACRHRRVFSTQNGYVGLGPGAMEADDVVAVFLGFPTPFILRRVDDYYLLVGEAYVYGIMRGEVLQMCQRGEIEEEEFEIH